MNLCVKPEVFQPAVESLDFSSRKQHKNTLSWNFIAHTDEIMKRDKEDLLYAHDHEVFLNNLNYFIEKIVAANDTFEFVTIRESGNIFRTL